MNEARIAREGVGRKFQRPTVFEDQTVADNLILALKANRSPWAVLFWRPKPADMARVGELASRGRAGRPPAPQIGRVEPRPEAMAGDRDAAGAGTAAFAGG
jgi:urea transport system ATP-binding protein